MSRVWLIVSGMAGQPVPSEIFETRFLIPASVFDSG